MNFGIRKLTTAIRVYTHIILLGKEFVFVCSLHDERCPKCNHRISCYYQFRCDRCGAIFRWHKGLLNVCLLYCLEEKLRAIPEMPEFIS